MRRELFHAVLMSIECAEIWFITCNTGSTADEVFDFHSAPCSRGEMINFISIHSFKLGFSFSTHPCLGALPASHHVHVEEPTLHGCNFLQVGAQRPAILLVNKDTQVEFVEPRVWSREPYLILLFAEKAEDDPGPREAGEHEGPQRLGWGLRAGSTHSWDFYQPMKVKITPTIAVRF